MPKWEYSTVPLLVHATKQILDNWGQDGWELVAVIPGPNPEQLVAYLKRPVGAPVGAEDAAECARICALNALAAVDALVGLDAVTRVVKVVGFVASAAGFTGQPGVVNGASG